MTRSDARRPDALAVRLRRAMVLVAALSVLAASAAFYIVWSTQVLALRAQELSRQVTALASGLSAGGSLDIASGDSLRSRLLRVQAGLIGARLLVVEADGRVALSTFPGGSGPASLDLGAFSRPDARNARVAVSDIGGGEKLLLVAAPIPGTASFLVGAQTVEDIRKARTSLAAVMAACMLLALSVAWLAGGMSARKLATPLMRLRAAAEAVAAGGWGAEVPVEGDEEAVALARAFNDMSRRVAAVYEAQKAFVSDVSHEIRTPVASIAGYAQAIEDGTASDEKTIRRFAGVIRDEARRLADLTSTLLALSDLDSGRVEIQREPVDAHRLAQALRDRFSYAGDRLEVGRLDPDGLTPQADSERLLQLASILVENALKHSPDDARVRVSAIAEPSSWTLLVDDEGPGVAPEDRERIFERFVRVDRARTAGGGSGLGLAIARRLVQLMGGSISVTDSPLGGARFIIALPRG